MTEPFRTVVIDSVDQIPQTVAGLLQVWYETEIQSLADDYAKRIGEGEFGYGDEFDDDALTESIDETTDGHEYVIYTWKARCVCAASDNESAYQDEIGEVPPTVEAQACMAMRADLRGHSTLTDAIDAAKETEDCEECGNAIPVNFSCIVSEHHDETCSHFPVPYGGSGYTTCTCGTCLETTVSSNVNRPELCSSCEDAGCEPGKECRCVPDDESEA